MGEDRKEIDSVVIYNLESSEDIGAFMEDSLIWNRETLYDSAPMRNWIIRLLEVVQYPITIVYESYYVDRVYRDEYYRYYSSKHFAVSRNCSRLILFHNQYDFEDFLSSSSSDHEMIETDLIGAIVLKPTGGIGRTLINPFKSYVSPCYVRTTKFEICVLGYIYHIDAFPASGQDIEFMTCAEVNVWQILEYFGARYIDHRAYLPSEMVDRLENSSLEVSILPSEGLTAEQEAYLFRSSGLTPKIYWAPDLDSSEEDNNALPLEDIIHIYVESGVPILINLEDTTAASEDNHCITCIGHEYTDFSVSKLLEKKAYIDITSKSPKSEGGYSFSIIPTWVQYDKFVVLEDHSLPYQLVDKNNLVFSAEPDAIKWKIASVVVPLHKHVFLSAEDAYAIFVELFNDTQKKIVSLFADSSADLSKKIVMRIFLTTSRAFKNFRVTNSSCMDEKIYYSHAAYPKMLWICEYGTPESYCEHKMNGEFVLDATASMYAPVGAVISMRHGAQVTYRNPSASVETSLKYLRQYTLEYRYAMFEQNNLRLTF